MKVLNFIQLVGYISLFMGSVFNLVNSFTEKTVFPFFVIILLMVIAVVGIACGIVAAVKNKK